MQPMEQLGMPHVRPPPPWFLWRCDSSFQGLAWQECTNIKNGTPVHKAFIIIGILVTPIKEHVGMLVITYYLNHFDFHSLCQPTYWLSVDRGERRNRLQTNEQKG